MNRRDASAVVVARAVCASLLLLLCACREWLGVSDVRYRPVDGGLDAPDARTAGVGGQPVAGAPGGQTGHDGGGAGAVADAGAPFDGAVATCVAPTGPVARLVPSKVQRFGGSEDDLITAIAPIGDDLVIVFNYAGIVDMGSSVYASWLDPTNKFSTQDFIVARVDRDMKVVWSKTLGGRGEDQAFALAVDGNATIYVGGTFERTAQLAGTTLTSNTGKDAFFVALDGGGNAKWARRMGGAADDALFALAVTASHDVIAAGVFTGAETFGLPTTLMAPNAGNAFLAGWNAQGDPLFARSYPSSFSIGVDVEVTPEQDVVVAGVYQGRVDLGEGFVSLADDPGEEASLFLTTADAKTGAPRAGRLRTVLGGPGAEVVGSLAVDGAGNVYLAGGFSDVAKLGGDALDSAGETDAFVASYRNDGTHRWSHSFGGAFADLANALDVSKSGDVFVVGSYTTRARFGADELSGTSYQGWLAQLAGCDGALTGVYDFGSSDYDEAYALAHDATGRLTIGGTFAGDVTFAPALRDKSAGKGDVVLLRFP